MHKHIVQPGSSLVSIARELRIPLSVLIDANQIADPNRIQVGQELRIPISGIDPSVAQAKPQPLRPVPSPIAIERKSMALAPGQYFRQKFKKDLIVLHFTAGSSARSAFDSWRSTTTQVATAYLVDTDGSIFECFPPEYWAYHLGVSGPESAGWRHDKRSIGIEIANVGSLRIDAQNPQQLNWWPNNFGTKYCTLAESTRYVAAPFRGFSHFASFPSVQCDAVASLVSHLCEELKIPRVLPPVAQQTAFDMDFFKSFRGIATHQNFRKDKSDIGPAFPLSRVAP